MTDVGPPRRGGGKAFQTVVYIPTTSVGAVIGRRGEHVTAVRQRYGCTVNIRQDRGGWRLLYQAAQCAPCRGA
jgi:hypothetical protein